MELQDGTGPHDRDIRCLCGQLIARWHPNGVRIKCKRCRRVVYVPFKSIKGEQPHLR